MRIIYTNKDTGIAAIVVPADANTDLSALAKQVVPAGISFEIVAAADIPTDRTFRNAWQHDTSTAPQKVVTDMTLAKVIAHTVRKANRDELMKPHDIMATVPSMAKKAEASRAVIRKANAVMQKAMDAAQDEAALIVAMPKGAL